MVLILVVAVIVMLAVIGAAYLQVARVQRAKPVAFKNLPTILQSVINEIKTQLVGDVRASDGTYFTAGQIESLDYPKVNATAAYPGSATWPTNGSTAGTATDPVDGTVKSSGLIGGVLDDTWLASTTPNAAGNAWPKISRLTPRFFQPSSGSDPADLSPGATGNWYDNATEEENVALNFATAGTQKLVDSDVDGVGDSRWERTPIPLMTGVEYFMAVRIVDLSALLNLNVATAMYDATEATQADDITGYYPTSLDLTRLLKRRTGGYRTGMNALFATRGNVGVNGSGFTPLGLTDLSPTTQFGTDSIMDAWLHAVVGDKNGASIYGDLAARGSLAAAMLYKGGQDDPDGNDWETNLGTTLMAGLAAPLSNTSEVQSHFFGSNPTTQASNGFSVIRHMVTPLSGHAVYAANHADLFNGATVVNTKVDLVYENATDPQARADKFNQRLQKIFALGSYTGGNSGAAQFAAAIQEYSDTDGKPSAAVNDGTNNYYGLEVLPFLREVYVQAGYKDDGSDSDSNPATLDWEPIANSQAVAVEIGNPFDRPITFGGNGPNVRVVILSGGSGSVAIPAGTLAPRASAASTGDEEELLVISNPISAVNEGGSRDDLANTSTGILSAAPTNTPVTAADGSLAFTMDGSQVVVALQVEDQNGNWITYDKMSDSALVMPTYVVLSNAAAVATQAHIQRALKRDGEKIRYISNSALGFKSRDQTTTDWPDDAGGYSSTIDDFGNDTKSGANGDTRLDGIQLPMANRSIFSVAELGWIMTVGFDDGGTPTDPSDDETFTEKLDARKAADFSKLFLDFAANPTIDSDGDGTDDLNHAEVVMDQFTTVSPEHDGINNISGATTGDGSDEFFVPGTINVNTAPPHILTLAAPLPETIADTQGLMDAIVTYRDDPTIRGIKSIGQLMEVGKGNGDNTDMRWLEDAGSGPPSASPGAEHDLYPIQGLETVAPFGAVQYDLDNDVEERIARFQFLSQAFTTRSDVFAAYILIKGYQRGSFGTGAKEVGRFIVIFDRSRITDANPVVYEVGRLPVN